MMLIKKIVVLEVDAEITPPYKPTSIMIIGDSNEFPMRATFAAGVIPGTENKFIGFNLANGLQVGCILTDDEAAEVVEVLKAVKS